MLQLQAQSNQRVACQMFVWMRVFLYALTALIGAGLYLVKLTFWGSAGFWPDLAAVAIGVIGTILILENIMRQAR